MDLSSIFEQYSVELLLTFLILLIGWMRLTSATQETAFEFEQRLQHSYSYPGGETKSFSNRVNEKYKVHIENVVFRESNNFLYMLKRTLWPWQDMEGEASFSVWTEGIIIDDMDEFKDSMPDWGRIVECTSEHHNNHYTVTLETTQENVPWDTRHGYDTFFHYFANSKHVTESDVSPGIKVD